MSDTLKLLEIEIEAELHSPLFDFHVKHIVFQSFLIFGYFRSGINSVENVDIATTFLPNYVSTKFIYLLYLIDH